MKNRILYISRTAIPYVKELMPLAKSIPGCLIMQQLDFWFEQKPEGFYKFMTQCNHHLCKDGDSWSEELGMSLEQFRTHFEKIGVRYSSKKEFDAAEDKFQGMFYCSYTDKRAGMTFWFRNHELLDKALDNLVVSKNHQNLGPTKSEAGTLRQQILGQRDSHFTGQRKFHSLRKGETHSLGDGDNRVAECGKDSFLETRKPIPGITETTFRDLQNQPQQTADEYSGQCSNQTQENRNSEDIGVYKTLVFPKKTLPEEKAAAVKKLAGCRQEFHQQILDEIEGAIRQNTLKRGIVPFCTYLVEAAKIGQFEPRAGIEVLALREKERAATAAADQRESKAKERMGFSSIKPETIANLPKHIRERVEASQQAAVKN
jgi:hypothetical protein